MSTDTSDLTGHPGDENDSFEPQEQPAAPEKSRAKAKSAPPRPRTSRAAGESTRRKRALVVSALERYQELESTDPSLRTAMAALLGCEDDLPTITAYSMTSAPDTSAVSALAELREGDELSAAIPAAALCENKNNLRKIWSLIEVVDPSSDSAPTSVGVTQAAVTLVRRVRALDPSSLDVFDAAASALS